MNLRIHRLAVAEIDREVDYYESRHSGLGTELEDEIGAAFSLILRFPKAAPQWRDRPDRRVAVLNLFRSRSRTRSDTRTPWSSRSHAQAVDRIIGRDVPPIDARARGLCDGFVPVVELSCSTYPTIGLLALGVAGSLWAARPVEAVLGEG
jgi:hypothetical protein